LSQSTRFERQYSSITDAITHGLSDADFKKIQKQNDLKKTISSLIENNQEKPNLNEIELILHRLKP
jgi:hypothetical protein